MKRITMTIYDSMISNVFLLADWLGDGIRFNSPDFVDGSGQARKPTRWLQGAVPGINKMEDLRHMGTLYGKP